MRALSFSLMRELEAEVDDTDQHLKELVVPLEHRDLCGGNLRYDNYVRLGWTTVKKKSIIYDNLLFVKNNNFLCEY
jgi:hypothetical protein